jgi:hypothetical protein
LGFRRGLGRQTESVNQITLLEFGSLIVMQEEIVETLNFGVVLEGDYFLVEFIEQKTAVLDDGAEVGGFEGEEWVKLLNQYRDEHIPYVYFAFQLLNFSSKCSNFSPDPSMVSSL